jgi:hypothetical protein
VLVAAARRKVGPPEQHTAVLYELPGHEGLSAIPGCRKLPHTDSLR